MKFFSHAIKWTVRGNNKVFKPTVNYDLIFNELERGNSYDNHVFILSIVYMKLCYYPNDAEVNYVPVMMCILVNFLCEKIMQKNFREFFNLDLW